MIFFWNKLIYIKQEARQSALQSNGGPGMGSDHQQSEPNIYVVNSSSMSMDQPLSSVTTTTSVLPDVTGNFFLVFKSKIINLFWMSNLHFTNLNFSLASWWHLRRGQHCHYMSFSLDHGLRTPNEGINQRYLKNWADVADKMCFGRT